MTNGYCNFNDAKNKTRPGNSYSSGKRMGSAGPAVNIQPALWPQSGTTTARWWASYFWFTYAPNARPRGELLLQLVAGEC
jgi:hypothetical protein